jgi:hypothetical protein
MALYIHPENQELLWKIVNKNPMIQEYFMRYPPNIKETWFKQIVSAFYDKNRNITFNTENLYEINRDTLNYMVQDVKRNVEHMQQQQMRPPAQQVPQMPLTGIPGRDDKKEEKFVSQYNQFQNEYYSMFDKKPPRSSLNPCAMFKSDESAANTSSESSKLMNTISTRPASSLRKISRGIFMAESNSFKKIGDSPCHKPIQKI